ncbi:hypothetical protein DFQ14_104272 [Halopolyspora algeriensis]|uniref:Uncharacterized protein n=1 Tax=Halopolyspora algeriensis TaxID=1500506 RepID=A0A368VRX4_9ACTN|nr:hypothetical protein [Halopolyspora algeriensis]RCW44682.1 hypothetical protein DFQ14_104272 [Halopolyspora algeriensis]TQM56040.1 hypothetical protein FHU43_0822 [Halopolyspora algeriensis]
MAKSSRTRRRSATPDFVEILPQPKQWIGFSILGLLVRWRAELTGAAVLLAVFVWLDGFGSAVLTVAVLVGVPAVLLAVPHTRRFLVARVWCVADRHRLRACLKRTKVRTMNRDGTYPFMLWARPTTTGERIWLWLPAGTAATDIENSLEYVAPACFARSARLHRPKKVTTFVAVDIIRRDPLEAKKPVSSPLAGFMGTRSAPSDSESVTPIKAASSASESQASEPSDSASTSTKTTTAAKPAAAGAVVVNGEDLSDYVD